MKTRIFFMLSLIFLFPVFILSQDFKTTTCPSIYTSSIAHPKATAIQSLVDSLVRMTVPGAVAAISDTNGTWVGASGFARLENDIPMGACHLHYLQSIAKTYLGVLILQLYEAGRIDLEAKADTYLPASLARRIQGIEKVTVRMLLNHTSGLPEYNYNPTYITRLLQNPDRLFTPIEYIDYVEKRKSLFEAGTKYMYLNFGYCLLSVIADYITGDHAGYMREKIFKPLGLKHTYYGIAQGNTYGDSLVNCYWDRHSNGTLENISVLQNSNVASMAGDDGLITTPGEAIHFLKGLIEGKLIKPETLAMMQDWVKDSKGNARYGMGLSYTTFAGEKAIGHSGGGLGAGAELYFFPEKNVYMFLAINLGTVTSSPIHTKAEGLIEELHKLIVK
jgi:D-alanyl-D-alanine carboxypeptidase